MNYTKIENTKNTNDIRNKKYIIDTDLIKQWDYEKNDKLNLYPDKLTYASNKKVHWICEKKHKWEANINNRTKGKGCPICSNNKILKGFNDLQTTHPDLLKEWDYKKNKIKPDQIGSGSNRKIYWICEKNHNWEASINHRANGKGCPYCTNRKVLKGYNDLHTTHPDLVKEWDYKLNELKPDEVSFGSHKKIYWICEKGHSWQTNINYRSNGTGCPYCSNKKILKGYNDLETTHTYLLKEWDYKKNKIKPDQIGSGSNKKVHWICEKNHNWEASINHRANGRGCPYCNESKGEKRIYELLNSYKIKHMRQYKIKDCKHKLSLPFDFAISKNDKLQYLIEYDGEQHYQSKEFFGGKKELLKIQKRDKIKTNYCKENNIKLIRIKYTDFDKIEDILIKELNL